MTKLLSPIQSEIFSLNEHKVVALTYKALETAIGNIIIAPAMGVPQKFYRSFAQWLTHEGYNVISFDYSGTGLSAVKSLRKFEVDIVKWAEQDCSHVIEYSQSLGEKLPLYWLGHSLGGQIVGLIPNIHKVKRVITVASGSGYWPENAPDLRNKVWLLWFVMVPVLTPLFGYFPGKRLGMVGDLPKGVIKQWRKWCMSPDYITSESQSIKNKFMNFTVPVTSISLTDDEMMSKENIESLLSFFDRAPKKTIRISPLDIGVNSIGHFGFFKDQYSDSLWPNYLLSELK